MNYIRIDKDNMVNGDGIRVVLWTAGCNHNCKNCHNPETWNCDAGQQFTDLALEEIYKELDKDYVAGLTLTGGDPMFPRSRQTILKLVESVKSKYPEKNIWMWTGYLYEELLSDSIAKSALKYIDVLVDGEFKEELKVPGLPLRGSTNQRIIDVQNSLKENKVVLFRS